MLEVENLPKDIVDPKNKIIKKANKDCLKSLGLGIVIRKSFFDLYPAENIYLKTLTVMTENYYYEKSANKNQKNRRTTKIHFMWRKSTLGLITRLLPYILYNIICHFFVV